jgi:uncharacterized protein (TIGR02145 family)
MYKYSLLLIGFILNAPVLPAQNPNQFSPSGRWFLKEEYLRSPGRVQLYVPNFISNCSPELLQPGPDSIQGGLLLTDRRRVYKDVFMELMLQNGMEEKSAEASLIAALRNVAYTGTHWAVHSREQIRAAYRQDDGMSAESKPVLPGSLPGGLELSGLLMQSGASIDRTAATAAIACDVLAGFGEAGYRFLKSAMERTKDVDPEMRPGLEDAFTALRRDRHKTLEELASLLAAEGQSATLSPAVTQLVLQSRSGAVIGKMASTGLLDLSLSASPPAPANFMPRASGAAEAQAWIVLLSTIDRTVFQDTSGFGSATDGYTFTRMRVYLTRLINLAAKEYAGHSTCRAPHNKPLQGWLAAYPNLNSANTYLLKSLEEKAMDEMVFGVDENAAQLPAAEHPAPVVAPDARMADATSPDSAGTVSDIDGNRYKIVQIGGQVWMSENLHTARYNDGAAIPLVNDNSAWAELPTPAYCWYENDKSQYAGTYGALYNWYAVNTGKLCPAGWRVPTDFEWSALTSHLGGEAVAGGKMKEAGTLDWVGPNDGGSNSSGFTGLPGGGRQGDDAAFRDLGLIGYWWSATAFGEKEAWNRSLYFDNPEAGRDKAPRSRGFSVRCLQNE